MQFNKLGPIAQMGYTCKLNNMACMRYIISQMGYKYRLKRKTCQPKVVAFDMYTIHTIMQIYIKNDQIKKLHFWHF